VLLAGADQGIGVVVAQQLLAVELPGEGAVLAGEDDVVAAVRLDLGGVDAALVVAVLVAADEGVDGCCSSRRRS
jgi:hypothetical protein